MKKENLKELKITRRDCERGESTRVIGFSQRLENGINIRLNLVKGKVTTPRIESFGEMIPNKLCPTAVTLFTSHLIDGHGGSPCINNDGKVIGMVSRIDSFEKHRGYLVPWNELRNLLNRARSVVS